MRSRKATIIAIGGLLIVGAIAFPRDRDSAPACIDVPSATIEDIASTLVNGETLGFAAAAKSASPKESFYVAAEIDGPGLDGAKFIGVWLLTPTLDPAAKKRISPVVRGNALYKLQNKRDRTDVGTMDEQAAWDAVACVDRGKNSVRQR